MTEFRKVERLVNDSWELIRLQDLKEGDIFRMTEPDDDAPFGKWKCKEDAKLVGDDYLAVVDAEDVE